MKPLFMALALVFAAACSDDDGPTNNPKDAGTDAGTTPDAPPCFEGEPVTHDQIINACTTAQKIYKNSKPPLLKADGTLPALPP